VVKREVNGGERETLGQKKNKTSTTRKTKATATETEATWKHRRRHLTKSQLATYMSMAMGLNILKALKEVAKTS